MKQSSNNRMDVSTMPSEFLSLNRYNFIAYKILLTIRGIVVYV